MNVVVVDSDVSFPATSGKRLRTLNLMLPLARRHRIVYLARAHASAGNLREAAEYFCDHGIQPVFVEHRLPSKRGPMFYAGLLGNLASPLPYSISSHISRPMQAAARRIAAETNVDVWQVEWASHLRATPTPRANTVLMAHNVESLIWQRSFETAAGALRRWYIRHQWKKFEAFERSAFHGAARVVAVSRHEAQLMAERFDYHRADVVENGVDVNRFADLECDRGSRKVLFLGALDWRPNQDALNQLLDFIFPQILQRDPAAQLVIVGRNPSPSLAERVRRQPQAVLHADVPDVAPYLRQSAAMIVPLRIGGGSRLKILESLAAGLPVISTPVGAEGLDLQPGVHFQQAETAEALAEATVATLANPAAARAMSERGRQRVQAQYDWPLLADKLETVWQQCAAASNERAAAAPPPRQPLLVERLS